MLAIALLLLACGDAPPPPGEATAPDTGVESDRLEASRLLARRSLDLRGRRPTLEELDAVEEAPDAVRRRSPISLHDGGMEGKLTGGSSVQEIPLEEGKRRQVKAAMSALTMIWDNGMMQSRTQIERFREDIQQDSPVFRRMTGSLQSY